MRRHTHFILCLSSRAHLIAGIAFIVLASSEQAAAQTLFVPSGTGGIGSSSQSGRVGIGTSNPSVKLDVGGATAAMLGSLSQATTFTGLSGSAWGGIVLGSGINGNSPFVAASRNGAGTALSLYLMTADTARMKVTDTGYVGIGNNSPAQMLHVAGVIRSDDGFQVDGSTVIDNGAGWHRSYGATGWYNGTYGGGWYMSDSTWIRTYGNKSIYHNTGTMRTDGTFQVGSSGSTLNVANGGTFAYRTNVLFANTSGAVGIGTTNPGTYKLAVNGAVRAKEVVVDSNWSDFVFDDDYALPSLDTVAAQIREHKHLPGVPSAAEIQQRGLSVGESQTMIMRKVEELTLYLLQLKKENQALQARVQELEARLNHQ